MISDKLRNGALVGIGAAIVLIDATSQLVSMLIDGALVGLGYLALKLRV